MQTANILLALGGDAGNTVLKSDVTPSEIALLRVIHGEDAVTDIEPTNCVERTRRQELSRLAARYGSATDEEGNSHMSALFPGAAAPIFENLKELDLDEKFFKPITRASVSAKAVEPPTKTVVEPSVEIMTLAQLKKYAELNDIDLGGATKKADVLKVVLDASAPDAGEPNPDEDDVDEDEDEDEDEDDTVKEIDDSSLFN